MKKSIVMLTIILLLAGCKSEISATMAPTATVMTSTPTNLPTMTPIITPEPTAIPELERFLFPFPGERLAFNHEESDITGWAITRDNRDQGLQISYTENKGVDWFTTILPTKQPWEKEVDQKHLFASLNATGPSWIMLALPFESVDGVYNKTLYRSDDKGRSWALLGDFTSVIEGELKEILFINDKEGWVTTNYRGTDIIPLYHTVDGGVTWSLEALPQEKGFRYANVSIPYFDSVGHATVKVEYISDAGKKTVYYESTDNGSTWQLFTFNSILKLNGDKAALEVVRQFAVAWQGQNEKKVSSLFEIRSAEYVSEYTSQLKKHKNTFYSAYSFLQPNDPTPAEFCMNLYYQNDGQTENEVGRMSVCLRQQPKSDKWKIYMLD
ncbi:hypothetical protein EHS13_27185 [Paenibacillus psychroresistens]|uniref:Exo-alpha-sialidase n=1 Tax=Paenibacillus psychroresistens TaxID=1778678 RepID=A0A6B8RSM6_9BACL|nr:hypothetical protein [Paenibacillus psychroresistens]QGQ98306.1 hypothetical protein EHS13_27185 [Paenibacillus psychroresistens]